MLHKMYSIRDLKGEIFNTPFPAPTHAAAERNFEQVVRDPKTTIAQYPSDYDLYYIGDYDDNTGLMHPLQVPQLQCNAVTLVPRNQPTLSPA